VPDTDSRTGLPLDIGIYGLEGPGSAKKSDGMFENGLLKALESEHRAGGVIPEVKVVANGHCHSKRRRGTGVASADRRSSYRRLQARPGRVVVLWRWRVSSVGRASSGPSDDARVAGRTLGTAALGTSCRVVGRGRLFFTDSQV
jgi:hypothetical protein